MTTLMDQANEVRERIEARKADAAAAWTTFEALRASAKSEGVDFTSDTDAFEKLDAAGKAYDAIRDEVKQGEDRWQDLVSLAAKTGEVSPRPLDLERDSGKPQVRQGRKTPGQVFLESEVYAELKASGRLGSTSPLGQTNVVPAFDREQTKALLSGARGKTLLDSGASSGGDLVIEDNVGTLVLLPQPTITILDMISVGTTDSDTVEWFSETTFTNAAAETAEGSAAAEAALVYNLESAGVKDITHFIPATKRILNDAAQLRTLVDQRLVYGVQKRLQAEIIAGGGTGEDLTGITAWSGVLAQALGSDTRSDAIHKAITQVRVNGEREPFAIGIHPDDAEQVFLEKDANGNYIYGPPSMPNRGTVWGLRAVVHTAFTSGNPVVGDYSEAMLWVREGVNIAASDSHDDYFTKKKVAVMASMRAAFAVMQPKAFCELTGF